MDEITLTSKEKTTLYGLVKFPDLNDRALSEKLDEKMSTVTSIRRRLHERGFFTKVRIPRFEKLGCEIMCIGHGSFKSVAPYGSQVLAKTEETVPSTYFGFCNPYHFVMLGAAKNYTEARSTYDSYYRNSKFMEAVDESDLSISYMSYSLTNLANFFEFAPLLNRLFGLNDKEPVKASQRTAEVQDAAGVPDDLSLTEKKVLLGLVKYPDSPDKALSEKIKVSRQVVSKIRKNLETEGYVRTAVIPDLAKLGLGMIIFTHYKINPKMAKTFDEKSLIGAREGLPGFFLCSGSLEFYSLSAFASYQEFERISEKYFKMYCESEALLGSPIILPFSIEDLYYFRYHTYSNILKKVLGI